MGDDVAADDVFKDLAWNTGERDVSVVFWGMAVSFLEGTADILLAASSEGGCHCNGGRWSGMLARSGLRRTSGWCWGCQWS